MDWLVTQLFDSISRVASLGMPVLFIHGSSDCVVPVFTAQRMYDHRAAGPKSLLIVPGAGHDNCAVVGGEQYVAPVKEFLGGLK